MPDAASEPEREEDEFLFEASIRADPSGAGEARAHLRGLDLPGQLTEDLALLATEMITNAVRHGGENWDERYAPLILRLLRTSAGLRLEVEEPSASGWLGPPSPDSSPRATPSTFPEGGYGLKILERLSTSWGARTHGRTIVWAELLESKV